LITGVKVLHCNQTPVLFVVQNISYFLC